MNPIEKCIASKVFECLFGRGYGVRFERTTGPLWTRYTSDVDGAVKECYDWDGAAFGVVDAHGVAIGWVRLVWGNGEDLISDYTVNLEDALKPALDVSDKIARGAYRIVPE